MDNGDKSQFLSTKDETSRWLDYFKIKNYTINNDLSVDVNDSVDISDKSLIYIPIKFRKVTGNFWCENNKLKNLSGSPELIDGTFTCANNKLISLAHSPKFVGGDFYCHDNHLKSLIEIVECDLAGGILFNIDENNFIPEELIQALELYRSPHSKTRYVISNYILKNTVKPILTKFILQQKLIKLEVKSKNNFI